MYHLYDERETLDITNLSGFEVMWIKNAEMKQMVMLILRKLGRLFDTLHKLSLSLAKMAIFRNKLKHFEKYKRIT